MHKYTLYRAHTKIAVVSLLFFFRASAVNSGISKLLPGIFIFKVRLFCSFWEIPMVKQDMEMRAREARKDPLFSRDACDALRLCLILNQVSTAPVRTKLAKSTNGARERQTQVLKSVNTGDVPLSSPLAGNIGSFQYVWRLFPSRAIFLFPQTARILRPARGFANASVRVARNLHPCFFWRDCKLEHPVRMDST